MRSCIKSRSVEKVESYCFRKSELLPRILKNAFTSYYLFEKILLSFLLKSRYKMLYNSTLFSHVHPLKMEYFNTSNNDLF